MHKDADAPNMLNDGASVLLRIFASSRVTELFEPLLLLVLWSFLLLFNPSRYGDGGSEVKSSDRWEVGQRVSIFTQLLMHTNTHTPDPVMLSESAWFKAAALIASLWL